MTYLTAVCAADLYAWYRHGELRLSPVDLVLEGEASHKLLLPNTLEDFEAVIVSLDFNAPPIVQGDGSVYAPFSRIAGRYAAHPSGLIKLPSKLLGDISLSANPEQYLSIGAAALSRRDRRKVGLAVNTVAELLGLDLDLDTVDYSIGSEGLALRDRHQLEGASSVVDAAMLYDRRKPDFPRTSIGYLFDLGATLRTQTGDDSARLNYIRKLSTVLSNAQPQGLSHLWSLKREHLDFLDEGTEIFESTVPLLSIVLFYELQAIVRKPQNLLAQLREAKLRAEEQGKNFAFQYAAILLARFFGFDEFAPTYYDMCKSSDPYPKYKIHDNGHDYLIDLTKIEALPGAPFPKPITGGKPALLKSLKRNELTRYLAALDPISRPTTLEALFESVTTQWYNPTSGSSEIKKALREALNLASGKLTVVSTPQSSIVDRLKSKSTLF